MIDYSLYTISEKHHPGEKVDKMAVLVLIRNRDNPESIEHNRIHCVRNGIASTGRYVPAAGDGGEGHIIWDGNPVFERVSFSFSGFTSFIRLGSDPEKSVYWKQSCAGC